MGGGDNTLATLTDALDGDGTNDLTLVTPNAGTATQQDFMLIYDRSTERAGAAPALAILPRQISSQPVLRLHLLHRRHVAPGDAVLMRDISLGVNHSLSLEHLYGQMFTIAGLAPDRAGSRRSDRHTRRVEQHPSACDAGSQFNQGGGGGLTEAQVDARILNQLPTPSAGPSDHSPERSGR